MFFFVFFTFFIENHYLIRFHGRATSSYIVFPLTKSTSYQYFIHVLYRFFYFSRNKIGRDLEISWFAKKIFRQNRSKTSKSTPPNHEALFWGNPNALSSFILFIRSLIFRGKNVEIQKYFVYKPMSKPASLLQTNE